MKKKRNIISILIAGAVLTGTFSVCIPTTNMTTQNVMAAVTEVTNDNSQASIKYNETMMQGFEWNVKKDGTFWDEIGNKASHLSNIGITSMWLPPAYKGSSNIASVGYDPYDLYDLGEFNQKGSVRTKYGTKEQYINAINKLHKSGIKVYADAVMNHKSGADSTEVVKADKVSGSNRNLVITANKKIEAWTVFSFAKRENKYSSFKWDKSCFDGVDWDQTSKDNSIFRFSDKKWDTTSTENGNYDYLMGADIDLNSTKVRNELKKWGAWYVKEASLDGFRVDAVKHMEYSFVGDWISAVEKKTGKNLFAVSEYLDGNVNNLKNYIKETGGETSLFDFPLFYRFRDASRVANTDLRNLLSNTLVSQKPEYAVTFVDNHDMQKGRSGDTVGYWFKPMAYSFILTRDNGLPCVFYGDYYGSGDNKTIAMNETLDSLMFARKYYAYGKQHDTSTSDGHVLAWSREGDSVHKNSGLVSTISSDLYDKNIKVYVGKAHAGQKWVDIIGNSTQTVTIDSNGYGTFKAVKQKACVYVNKASIATNLNIGATSGLKKSSVEDKSVKLSWSKVSNADGYAIYKYNLSSKKWVYAKSTTSNSTVLTGLTPAAKTSVYVKAYRLIGGKRYFGKQTSTISFFNLPSRPTITVKAGITKAVVSWKKPCNYIAGYEILMATSKNGTYKSMQKVGPNATSKKLVNLTSGKTYYFKVRAYRYNGSSKSDGIVNGHCSSIVSVKIK